MTMAVSPLIVSVAPNGARRTKADHPALPMTVEEMVATAVSCVQAGAAMLHLHVRDEAGQHVLDADRYRATTAAIRAVLGDRIVIQITTEAVGRYTPAEQRAVVRAVRPEAVSLALRELMPEGDAEAEREAQALLSELVAEGAMIQPILYTPEEVRRYHALRQAGTIPDGFLCPLFVLGRYRAGQVSAPADLLPFLAAWGEEDSPWMVCAFGPQEAACATTALALGGHVRVGFENNLWRPGGAVATDNAELVRWALKAAAPCGRPIADAAQTRRLLKQGGNDAKI